jgi:aldose 1-epimerase
MSIQQLPFGRIKNEQIVRFILTNKNGLTASVTNFGAILISFKAPDRYGKIEEVTLGYDTLEDYLKNVKGTIYFGATVGRVANRISKGRFILDGKQYTLALNNGSNHLHGGPSGGLARVVWKANPYHVRRNGIDVYGVSFTYISADGEEGYPGEVSIEAVYELDDANHLIFRYNASTNKPTPLNITNHTFWNLGGPASGPILDHMLLLNAKYFLPVDQTLIPTGEIRPVAGSALDFLDFRRIGERIAQVQDPTNGYDHCFVLNKPTPNSTLLTHAATVRDQKSGREMQVYTTQPGIQLYTGNFLTETKIAQGVVINKQHAFCLETQGFPNAVNTPTFPSVILRPGERYDHTTVHVFTNFE